MTRLGHLSASPRFPGPRWHQGTRCWPGRQGTPTHTAGMTLDGTGVAGKSASRAVSGETGSWEIGGSESDRLPGRDDPGLAANLALTRMPTEMPRASRVRRHALPVTWSFSSVTSAFR